MKNLYERNKNKADRTVRCYLTLNCNSNCNYCSARIPYISNERKKVYISAEVWAEGLNRRKRDTILCGGEPFLYPEFPKLISLIEKGYKREIYTNLGVDVQPFLNSAKEKYRFLISLHTSVKDYETWYGQVELLHKEGHSIRFHVVKQGNYQERIDFLKSKGDFKITRCDDQTAYTKSQQFTYPLVNCSSRIYLFGPDGYRYNCVTKLGLSEDRFEHISEEDSTDWLAVKCTHFGNCAGCDNLQEGKTWI